MLRTLRGPLGWVLAASLVIVACGGAAGPGGAPQATQALGTAERPIILAFTPSQDVQAVTASGNAIAAALEQATGLKWRVSVPTSYAAQIEAMCAGQADIAFIAPLQMTLLLDRNCGTPVLASLRRNRATNQLEAEYFSQIVVRSDSGINDLAGLRGKRFAFTDALSASGFVFPVLTIKQKTGQEWRTFFSQTINAGGHDRAVLAVYNGQVDGAATFIDVRTRRGMPADIMEKTKVIERAGPIPNDGVALRRGFPEDVGRRVVAALEEYGKTEAGQKALRELFEWDGMRQVDAKFYDPMKEAARLAGIDVQAEAARTPRPRATPAPSPTPTRSP